jgi:perosamine synthetase
MIPIQRPFLGPEELAAVAQVFDSRWLGMGEVTACFEEKLRAYLGVQHVLAVNTGTSALHLALESLDLPRASEVIVPSLTFVATPQAVLAAGLRPVFCEVQPRTLTLDIDDAFRRITPQTKAILPVHYGGQACDMDRLLPHARELGLRVIEDAAHAFGSSYRGRKVGTLGDVTCFSFDPIKNITCGEGGAIATNDAVLAGRAIPRRLLGLQRSSWDRQRGRDAEPPQAVTRGYRYHLSNINAAIGLQQLARLEAFKERKQGIVRRYDDSFRPIDGLVVLEHDREAFPFFYVLRVVGGRRDALARHLREHEIGTGIHYPPNHLQPLFAGDAAPLPTTEQLYTEILTLPLYFEMTGEDVERVIAAVVGFFGGLR